MLRVDPKVVAIAATCVLLATGMAPEAAADEDLAAAVRALADQVAQIQGRLAALEARDAGDPDPEPAVSGVSIQEELEGVADGVESLEARLVGAQTLDLATEIDNKDSGAVAARSAPRTARAKSAYLPSRGWLEGMHYGSDELDIQFHTFLDSEYIDSGPDGSRSGVSTFDNHHANFFVTAELRENLRAHSEFEFEHSGDKVEIDAALIEWAPRDWLTLTAGRFYTPLGIERFVNYSPTNTLVSRPQPMQQIVPGNFYANGLMVAGNLSAGERSAFTYELAISNGLGADAVTDRRNSRQTRDNNSNRAVTARFAFAPHANLEFGASHHSQSYDDSGRLGLELTGFDLAGRWSGWELRGEYVEASIETAFAEDADSVSPAPDLEQDGWYGQLGYTYNWFRTWLPTLTLVTRYDSVDLDAATHGANDQDFWSLGINGVIHDHFRLKAEYRMAGEDGPPKDNDAFLSQFVIDF